MKPMAPRAEKNRRSAKGLTLCSLGLPVVVASAEALNLNIFDPSSPTSSSIRSLFYLVLGITGFIFVLVEGILVYSIFRFRAKKQAASEADQKEPPQVYGSMPIELAWTIAPLLIVFILFLVVVRTVGEVKVEPTEGKNEETKVWTQKTKVIAIGHQWWWEYRYVSDDGKETYFTTANELHVPRANVKEGDYTMRRFASLDLQSADVAHSFWVPRLAGKTDMIPGQVNHLWFESEHPGLYVGQCAEYCGTQHAKMLLRVYVDEPDEYIAWFENQKKPARAPQPGETEIASGKKLFFSLSCVNCHTIRTDEPVQAAKGTFGPDLTHFASRETIAAYDIKWRENYEKPGENEGKMNLKVWLKDPNLFKNKCNMPNFNLTPTELDQMAAYLGSLE